MELEETKAGRHQIIVTELPYQVNKATLIERIADLAVYLEDHNDFAGDLLSFTLTCPENTGDTVLEFDGASFIGAEPDLGPPTLIGATISCFGPVPDRPQPGDVDCSLEVNSIDAALVLQYTAGLLERLDCQFLADVNFDGTIDSRDALIILQDVAGLFQLSP